MVLLHRKGICDRHPHMFPSASDKHRERYSQSSYFFVSVHDWSTYQEGTVPCYGQIELLINNFCQGSPRWSSVSADTTVVIGQLFIVLPFPNKTIKFDDIGVLFRAETIMINVLIKSR